MKQFLLLLHEDIKRMQALSPKQMQEIASAHMAWANKLAESGHLIGGDGLHEKSIIISGKDCVIQDGPYLEAKEIIGGYIFATSRRFGYGSRTCQGMPNSFLWRYYRNSSCHGNGGLHLRFIFRWKILIIERFMESCFLPY